jgi:putative transposase
MPRYARDLPADSVTHIIDRGVERRRIFIRDEDSLFFLAQMREVFLAYGIGVLNYVLMPNHFHIQAISGGAPVGVAMQLLLTRYALYFNRVYERVGHLFQNRFKSFQVRDDAYLVQLPVYITRNPLRAGLVARVEDWEWSGHHELVSGRQRYLDLSRLEEVSGMSSQAWRDSYLELVKQGQTAPSPSATLDELLEHFATLKGISGRDLVAGEKGEPFTAARRLFVREAVRRGHTRVDAADALGCTKAAVTQLLAVKMGDRLV